MKNAENIKRAGLLLAILLLQLLLLLYFGGRKQGMHWDEFYTYFTSNNSWGRNADDRCFTTSEDIYRDFVVLPGEGFRYGRVVQMQSWDVHPPIYYLILHTVCSLMPNVFSSWQGVGINVVCCLLTTVFYFLSAMRIVKNRWAAAGVTLVIALNPGFITNVFFVRMYTLLGLWIAIAVWLHLRMEEKWHWAYYPLNAVLAYLGFLTHYYYVVFLFFLEAAFWLPVLKKQWKRFWIYAGSMLAGGVLAVVSYPACAGHILVGYRGKEAQQSFLNPMDWKDRWNFFTGLLDKYAFQHCFYIVLGLLLVLVAILFIQKRMKKMDAVPKNPSVPVFLKCVVLPTVAYYLVTVKISLNSEESNMRYQLPVYGLILMSVLLAFYYLNGALFAKRKAVLTAAVIAGMLVLNGIGIAKGQVNYLYEEVGEMVDYARAHSGDAAVYIYHEEERKYLLWADSSQLWQYDRIYFMDSRNQSPVRESAIQDAERVIVYLSNLGMREEAESYLDMIFEANSGLSDYEKVYSTVYADVYELY